MIKMAQVQDSFLSVCRSLAECGFVDDAAKMMCASPSAACDDALLDQTITGRFGSLKRTRIMIAASSGDVQRLSQLLRDSRGRLRRGLQAGVDIRDTDGTTALWIALCRGNVAAAGMLLDAGAAPLHYDESIAPLAAAATKSHLPGGLEALNLVLAAASRQAAMAGEDWREVYTENLHFALKAACSPPSQLGAAEREQREAAAREILRKLAESGAISNATVLIAAEGLLPDVLQAVLDGRVGLLHMHHDGGSSPLHVAAEGGRADNVRLLLSRYRELIASGATGVFGNAYTAELLDLEVSFAIVHAGSRDLVTDASAGREVMEALLGALTSIDIPFTGEHGAADALRTTARRSPQGFKLLLDRLAGHPRLLESLHDGEKEANTPLHVVAAEFLPEAVRDVLSALRRACADCALGGPGQPEAPSDAVKALAAGALRHMSERMLSYVNIAREEGKVGPASLSLSDVLARSVACAELLLQAGADAFLPEELNSEVPCEDADEHSVAPFWVAIRCDALEVAQLYLAKSGGGVERYCTGAVRESAVHGSTRCLRYFLESSRTAAVPEGSTHALLASAFSAVAQRCLLPAVLEREGSDLMEKVLLGMLFKSQAQALARAIAVLSEEGLSAEEMVGLDKPKPGCTALADLVPEVLVKAAMTTDAALVRELLPAARQLLSGTPGGASKMIRILRCVASMTCTVAVLTQRGINRGPLTVGSESMIVGTDHFGVSQSSRNHRLAKRFKDFGAVVATVVRAPEWDQPASTAAEVMASSVPVQVPGGSGVAGPILMRMLDEFFKEADVAVRDAFVLGIKLGLGEDTREL